MVLVLMVGVVDMPMRMEHRLMDVVMAVPFREMKPHAHAHQERCQPEHAGRRFLKEHYGHRRPNERCGGKIRARPGCPKPP
jgi:hypothetical protein